MTKEYQSPNLLSAKQARDSHIHAVRALDIYGPGTPLALLWLWRDDVELLQFPRQKLRATVRETFFRALKICNPDTGKVFQLMRVLKDASERYCTMCALPIIPYVPGAKKQRRKDTKRMFISLNTAILNIQLYAAELHGYTESVVLLRSAVTSIRDSKQALNSLYQTSTKKKEGPWWAKLAKAEAAAEEMQVKAVQAARAPTASTALPTGALTVAEVDFERELQALFDPVQHAVQVPATPLFLPRAH